MATLVFAGCAFLPPRVECGRVDPTTCERLAAQIVERVRAERPDRRIVVLRIGDDRGSYQLELDDGTGEAVIVD